jgi:hypothetical protein
MSAVAKCSIEEDQSMNFMNTRVLARATDYMD